MRLLEVVLLVAAVLGAMWVLSPWRTSRIAAVLVVITAAAALTVQAVVEGTRWQLFPVQAGAVTVIVCGLVVVARGRPAPAKRLLAVAVGTLALAGGATAWAVPIDVLPEPSGPHAVGTTTVTLVHPDWVERYGPTPGQPRRIVAQVWYPADPAAPEQPGTLVSDIDVFSPAAADGIGLPAFVVRHLGIVPSHATPDAAPLTSAAPLPVVVYSHGWRGYRTIHTNLLEDLASQGYLVIAVDHTYASLATVFDNGEVAALDPGALPEDATPELRAAATAQLVETFAADLALVADALIAGDLPIVAPHAETDRIVFAGYATGGGAAILACSRTDRCAAVVDFDPWVDPLPDDVIGAGLSVPLLSIRSQEWAAGPEDRRLRRLHAATVAAEGRVELVGTTHNSFTITPLLSRLTGPLVGTGTTPSEVCHRVVQEWTRRFLDHHVRGSGSDPLRFPPDDDTSALEIAAG